ncbi:hypothetical protein [Agaribacter flavus]|uniref:Uncharacterized protein n=1 Tax=Agaribacter flavus TaxID=1902781 RepID=A0ABV7FM84_9ALTE
MSHQANTWDGVVKTWKINDTSIDKTIPSDKVLIAQITKQHRHKKMEVLANSIASIALAIYVVFEMYSGLPSVADIILYSVFLVIAISVGVYTFLSSKRFIDISTGSTQSHVTVLLEQSKNNLKYLSFCRIVGLIVLTIMLFLIGLIGFVALNKPLEFKHYLVAGVALAGSLICAGVFVWGYKQSIQLKRQVAFLTEIGN